jgi:hypothetical protein
MIAAAPGFAFDQFGHRRSAKFSSHDNERVVEQPALFQILDERGDRLINLRRQIPVRFPQAAMAVPRLTFTMPELAVTRAPFKQTSGNQSLASVHTASVGVTDSGWLFC